MSIHILNKSEGETPLECINRARVEGVIDKNVKATYAGRLDPMAEGVLVVLTDKLVHDKDKYLNLDKEYEVDILFGMSTDTADILGVIKETKIHESFDPNIIYGALQGCVGEFVEEYPKYSSRPVDGKPFFAWARSLVHKDAPTHMIKIFSCENIGEYDMRGSEIEKETENRIAKVNGDFRQNEIMSRWKEWVEQYGGESFQVVRIQVKCASGAYMRVLAEKIGQKLGVPALAYKINRTKVGDYTIV